MLRLDSAGDVVVEALVESFMKELVVGVDSDVDWSAAGVEVSSSSVISVKVEAFVYSFRVVVEILSPTVLVPKLASFAECVVEGWEESSVV